MSIKQLIVRNLKKNLKNYYLYVFALIFSVALYFAFVTLQFDPALDEQEGTVKGAAAIKAATVLLIVIVTVFLVYANNIFIKRRSKEIGLFQLVGLTKGKIFQILSVENMIIYFGSMIVGIFLGLSISKLIMMILLKILGVDEVAALSFSVEAFIQTVLVFTGIFIVIMLMNAYFLKRHKLLSLFHKTSITEQKLGRISIVEMVLGIFGIGLIAFGYYVSTKLFSGQFMMMNELFLAMITILGSVILGTFLFYKGSVSFIFNVIRKRNNGYLSINKVLSLSSIMFRMRSNSFLLTVITTISALAIGLLSLSYISYYSAEKSAEQSVPNHFSIPNLKHAETFTSALEENDIPYNRVEMDFLTMNTDISDVIEMPEDSMLTDLDVTPMQVLSDAWVEELDVSGKDGVFINIFGTMQAFLTLKDSGELTFIGEEESHEVRLTGTKDINVLPLRISQGGFPVLVVDEELFHELAEDEKEPEDKGRFSVYVGVDIENNGDLGEANELFHELEIEKWAGNESQLEIFRAKKQDMGLMMFIVGFLGLTFLITSGCILYFKQMEQSEEEKDSYTILRKLGFTKQDLLGGIKVKQLFNFGIPLVLGLLHSYFAVKSGWFFFGTELWTPMIAVMVLYTLLYSIFGILSVLYYKKVIHRSL